MEGSRWDETRRHASTGYQVESSEEVTLGLSGQRLPNDLAMASLRSFLDQQVRLLSQPLTVPPDFNTHPAVKKINEKHPDSDPIPIAVIQATVSKVNSDLEAARKLKLTKKSTASVLEQLHAVQREDRKELDAAAREGKVRVRVDLQEGGTR